VGYNRQFDWLISVHCDAIMHCGPWHCLASLSVFFHGFGKTIAFFKIQNLSESKKEYTKGTKQFYL
jgi:hypothetical protein